MPAGNSMNPPLWAEYLTHLLSNKNIDNTDYHYDNNNINNGVTNEDNNSNKINDKMYNINNNKSENDLQQMIFRYL